MSGFNEWLDNKWQLLLGAGRDDWDDEDMKIAYNKGMDRAAEIADDCAHKDALIELENGTPKQCTLDCSIAANAIRKEIETISISDIRKEIEK